MHSTAQPPSPPPAQRPPQLPQTPAEPPRLSWPMLLVLLLMLAGMWLWQSSVEPGTHPGIDYTTFYAKVEGGQVDNVTVRGQRVEGKFRQPQQIDGQKIEVFHT